MNGRVTSSTRNGAATALSARYLARRDSRTAGIIACGVQGRTNLRALATRFPLERVFVYDVVPEVQRRFVEEMSATLGIDVVGVTSPKDAVVDSDLVVTSGPIRKHPEPAIESGWLRPGAFASAVDFDSYWTPAALGQFDAIVTDDRAQFDYYRSVGYFQATPDPHASLEELVVGTRLGRRRDDERTLAVNLGLALDDMAVAPEVHRRARAAGIGTRLAL